MIEFMLLACIAAIMFGGWIDTCPQRSTCIDFEHDPVLYLSGDDVEIDRRLRSHPAAAHRCRTVCCARFWCSRTDGALD
jgi:hypothetical protein